MSVRNVYTTRQGTTVNGATTGHMVMPSQKKTAWCANVTGMVQRGATIQMGSVTVFRGLLENYVTNVMRITGDLKMGYV